VFVKSDEASYEDDGLGLLDSLPLWFWVLVSVLSLVVSGGLVFLFYRVRARRVTARAGEETSPTQHETVLT
jgi:hypothetical protein